MKKTLLIMAAIFCFLVACVDKKAEEEKKKAAELNQQIETLDQEINQEVNQGLESLEKEAQEIDNSLNELDNL
ncbi:hypothetical protein ABW636_02130 [Aquimarina sp. 2201CG1-2-11]|uniref:hypothetical protein n=1 Tax=Aquimarina discodermiae TaxID=3231043 RepID=UPI003462D9CC